MLLILVKKALDADPRAIQQTKSTDSVQTKSVIYYSLEQSKETELEFFKGTAKFL